MDTSISIHDDEIQNLTNETIKELNDEQIYRFVPEYSASKYSSPIEDDHKYVQQNIINVLTSRKEAIRKDIKEAAKKEIKDQIAREEKAKEDKRREEKERKEKNLKKYGNIFQYNLIVEVIQEVTKKPYKDSDYKDNQIENGLKKLGVEIINKLTETERDDQIENDLNNLKDEFKKSLIESNKNVMKKFIAKYRDKYNILYV